MRTFSLMDVEAAMEGGGLVRMLRILTGAMAAAPLAYMALGWQQLTRAGQPVFPAPILLVLLGLVAAADLVLAWWLPKKRLRALDLAAIAANGLDLPKGRKETDRGAILGDLVRANLLLRLAMVHAVAIYGLFIAFLAPGAARVQPLYYLALAPCALVSLQFLLWMPTESSVRRFMEDRLLGHPSNRPGGGL